MSLNSRHLNNITSMNALSEGDFLDILIITNKLFGEDYVSKFELQNYVDGNNKTGLVTRKNNTITGFQLMLTCGLDEMMSLVLCQRDWFKEQFSNHLPIGIIKTIAVSDEFKNQGIGTALTLKGIEMLEKTSNCIISICWDQKDNTPFSTILEKCGMKLTRGITEYWREDSLNKNYKCKICGPPPCRCDAFIYQYFGSLESKQVKQELTPYKLH